MKKPRRKGSPSVRGSCIFWIVKRSLLGSERAKAMLLHCWWLQVRSSFSMPLVFDESGFTEVHLPKSKCQAGRNQTAGDQTNNLHQQRTGRLSATCPPMLLPSWSAALQYQASPLRCNCRWGKLQLQVWPFSNTVIKWQRQMGKKEKVDEGARWHFRTMKTTVKTSAAASDGKD